MTSILAGQGWRDLVLKAAEQITDSNWLQEMWWMTDCQELYCIEKDAYDNAGLAPPVKACATGHLFWAAKDQGLTFREASDFWLQVEDKLLGLDHDCGPLSFHDCERLSLSNYNDTHGRTSSEVVKRLKRIAEMATSSLSKGGKDE